MARRFTVQYADPQGPHPLAHDAAWQLYGSTDDADVALADVAAAGRRTLDRQTARLYPPYAVRILDGDVVVMVDVPDSVDTADDRDNAETMRELIAQANAAAEAISDSADPAGNSLSRDIARLVDAVHQLTQAVGESSGRRLVSAR